jgi:hypothetical protein
MTDKNPNSNDDESPDDNPDKAYGVPRGKFQNPYLAAAQARTREDQLAALVQFSTEEVESRAAMCDDLQTDGEIEDEAEWTYQKGYLDACRTFMGLHLQAYWGYKTIARQKPDE